VCFPLPLFGRSGKSFITLIDSVESKQPSLRALETLA
jgi:hypothetical protein